MSIEILDKSLERNIIGNSNEFGEINVWLLVAAEEAKWNFLERWNTRANDSIYTFALYIVLSVTRHGRNGHVSLVIGSRNGKTVGRLDLSTLLRLVLLRHSVWKCRGRHILPRSSFPRSRSFARRICAANVYLGDPPFRFIRPRPARLIVRTFVHLSVHLSAR